MRCQVLWQVTPKGLWYEVVRCDMACHGEHDLQNLTFGPQTHHTSLALLLSGSTKDILVSGARAR